MEARLGIMSLVSICIPCHNAEEYVGAALDSVLAQTWPNIEVIVVNDGSTDGSKEILAGYDGERVRVIHKQCGSAAKARNLALRMARGGYIKFFDADDLMSPEMLSLQMARLKGRLDAVASSEWGRFQKDDLGSFKINPESVWRDMDATDWLVEAWADARPMMQPGMFLIPRELIEIAGEWDEELTLIDDFEFFARIISQAKDVLFSKGATLYYRSRLIGSLSGMRGPEAVESAFHSLMRGTEQLLSRRSDLAARLSCANLLQDFIYTYYPSYSDLRGEVAEKIIALGGSDLQPDGPPKFQLVRKFTGWKTARLLQRCMGR